MKDFVEFVQSLATVDGYRNSKELFDRFALEDVISGESRRCLFSYLKLALNSLTDDMGKLQDILHGERTQEFLDSAKNFVGRLEIALGDYDTVKGELLTALPSLKICMM